MPAETVQPSASSLIEDLIRYQVDFLQRTMLFLDTMRERADVILARERAGIPPVLSFQSEIVADEPPLPSEFSPAKMNNCEFLR